MSPVVSLCVSCCHSSRHVHLARGHLLRRGVGRPQRRHRPEESTKHRIESYRSWSPGFCRESSLFASKPPSITAQHCGRSVPSSCGARRPSSQPVATLQHWARNAHTYLRQTRLQRCKDSPSRREKIFSVISGGSVGNLPRRARQVPSPCHSSAGAARLHRLLLTSAALTGLGLSAASKLSASAKHCRTST